MFGIGETELVIIVIFAFLLFGPDKLPGMGRTIGRVLRQFREAQEGFTEVVQKEVLNPLNEAMEDVGAQNSTKRAAALKEDADRESKSKGKSKGAPAKGKTETFAERKARAKTNDKKAAGAEGEKKPRATDLWGSTRSGDSAPVMAGDVGAQASVVTRPTRTPTSKRLRLLVATSGRPPAALAPKRQTSSAPKRLRLLVPAMPTRRLAKTLLTPPCPSATSMRHPAAAPMRPSVAQGRSRRLVMALPERLHPRISTMSPTAGKGA